MDIIKKHTYVGMSDETHVLLQHGTRLYLTDVANLSRDLFYQQVFDVPVTSVICCVDSTSFILCCKHDHVLHFLLWHAKCCNNTAVSANGNSQSLNIVCLVLNLPKTLARPHHRAARLRCMDSFLSP